MLVLALLGRTHCLLYPFPVNYVAPSHRKQMVRSTGPVLLLLGLSGAMGQVFIFVTISKFGALTCSIIGGF